VIHALAAPGLVALGLAASTPVLIPASYPVVVTDGTVDCNGGVVFKTFGGARWKVLGCADGRSLAFKADQPKGKVACIVFLWATRSNYGFDGSACRTAHAKFKAGIDEIRNLPPKDVAGLVGETRPGR
jgi:hypothetical protein